MGTRSESRRLWFWTGPCVSFRGGQGSWSKGAFRASALGLSPSVLAWENKAVSGGRPLQLFLPFPLLCHKDVASRFELRVVETKRFHDQRMQARDEVGRVGRGGGCWRRSLGDSCRILGTPVNITPWNRYQGP
jgi:hypothetical protein